MSNVGRELAYYDRLHSEKYRDENQTKEQHSEEMARSFASNEEHEERLLDIFKNDRFLPAGRIQAALGATEREVSPFNCSVSQKIEDNMTSIMTAQMNAVKILRLGTGIGYNFSHLRPKNDLIVKLKTNASGPVSFMRGFNEYAGVVASSGHRRGAQMSILNVDHPDIYEFIDAKMEKGAFRQFNFSVGITDKFMNSVRDNKEWNLTFGGKIYRTVMARDLWDKIMRNAYESAEPGVVYLDTMNNSNNLYYCEEIEATNPCAEQPLPPYGLCTLGSFNMIHYMHDQGIQQLYKDVKDMVEAYDNVFDRALYAIPQHKEEALNKRRIGLGFTGISNAIEYHYGRPSYGSVEFCRKLDYMCYHLTRAAYESSAYLAHERGPFPLYDKDKYLSGNFIQSLPEATRNIIAKFGIRNSHLISYAPCGTISQAAGNTSSGVEPIFYHKVNRKVYMKDGLEEVILQDYMVREHGFHGRTLEDCSLDDHLRVLETIQRYTDSAVSKTINVPSSTTFEDYKDIYMKAYNMGAKGCTVFRPTELRGAVITKAEEPEEKFMVPNEVALQYIESNCRDGVCTM